MMKNITTVGIVVVFGCLPMIAGAQEKPKNQPQDGAKELSGISIVGNKEAPKSLFIVPWKSSEIGVETGLASRLLNEKMQAVDKEVFERELDFYTATAR
jgi:hypothetical protein